MFCNLRDCIMLIFIDIVDILMLRILVRSCCMQAADSCTRTVISPTRFSGLLYALCLTSVIRCSGIVMWTALRLLPDAPIGFAIC